jgi:hypothetical protein
MSIAEIKQMLKNAAKNLFENQPTIYDFTPESGRSEWNLAHHLANEIMKLCPSLDCDLEIPKRNIQNKRPDIILHRRGTHEENRLVVEVKTDLTRREIDSDIDKVRTDWFRSRLCYQFGSVVHLKDNKTADVKVFRNEYYSPLRKRVD